MSLVQLGAAICATGGTDAAAQGKQKLEDLGEVTTKVTNNRSKASQLKGKGKDVEPDSKMDSKPAKALTTAESVNASIRLALRRVAGKAKASNATSVFRKIEPKEEAT